MGRFVMQKIARAPLLAVVVLGLSTAGCGTGSDLSSHVSSRNGGTVNVVMKSLDFTPTAVHAKVGEHVMWTNEDSSPHNVIYVSGPRFRSSRPVLGTGAKFSISLTEPGTIHYFCSIHPWMKATIVVSR